jgi:hypothetical protein
MVSSVAKIVLIGAGLAIAAGLAYVQYQFQAGESPSSQLARSRLGQDKTPKVGTDRLIDIIEDVYKNSTGGPIDLRSIINNRTSNAGFIYDLSREEEKYEPWALR